MHEETSCVVSTCRQVVMDNDMQGTNDSVIDMLYRGAQRYDFESSFAVYVGAFALFGFLPVVPGACGLYRWEIMREEPLEWYFKIVNTSTPDCGITLSNLKIAEDRILSYSAVLKSAYETKMCIVPNIEFYFEAEIDLAQLAKQRRRWINGTFAGYLYLIYNWRLIGDSQMSKFRKLFLFLLICCQALVCLLTQLTPSLFLCLISASLDAIFFEKLVSRAIFTIMVFFYIIFVVRHINPNEETTFINWMFLVLLVIGLFSMPTFMICSIIFYGKFWLPLDSQYVTIYYAISYGTIIVPIFINIHHFQSFCRSLRGLVPFYLFLPTLVAWFSSYASARFWDASWGNRPEETTQNIFHKNAKKIRGDEEKLKVEAKKKIQSEGFIYSFSILLCNLLVILLYVTEFPSLALLITVAGSFLQLIFSLFSIIFLFFNYTLGRIISKTAFIFRKILQKTETIQINLIETSDEVKMKGFRLGFFQLVVNASYQTILQFTLESLLYYNSKSTEMCTYYSIGIFLMEISNIVIGLFINRN